MRPQPLALEAVTAPEMRDAPRVMGGDFLMHRYHHKEHIDDPTCWCDPLQWTAEQCYKWPLRDIQTRLDEFFCVH